MTSQNIDIDHSKKHREITSYKKKTTPTVVNGDNTRNTSSIYCDMLTWRVMENTAIRLQEQDEMESARQFRASRMPTIDLDPQIGTEERQNLTTEEPKLLSLEEGNLKKPNEEKNRVTKLTDQKTICESPKEEPPSPQNREYEAETSNTERIEITPVLVPSKQDEKPKGLMEKIKIFLENKTDELKEKKRLSDKAKKLSRKPKINVAGTEVVLDLRYPGSRRPNNKTLVQEIEKAESEAAQFNNFQELIDYELFHDEYSHNSNRTFFEILRENNIRIFRISGLKMNNRIFTITIGDSKEYSCRIEFKKIPTPKHFTKKRIRKVKLIQNKQGQLHKKQNINQSSQNRGIKTLNQNFDTIKVKSSLVHKACQLIEKSKFEDLQKIFDKSGANLKYALLDSDKYLRMCHELYKKHLFNRNMPFIDLPEQEIGFCINKAVENKALKAKLVFIEKNRILPDEVYIARVIYHHNSGMFFRGIAGIISSIMWEERRNSN